MTLFTAAVWTTEYCVGCLKVPFFVPQEKENIVKFYIPFLVMATIILDGQLFLHICFSHLEEGMEEVLDSLKCSFHSKVTSKPC